MRGVKYRYRSLADFLIANPLHADGQLDDGWGAPFPVKGREIDATILFSDISAFSARTLELSPVETLAFVNNFFAWITAEALRPTHGIVDKYIGDALMIAFSTEFGSEDSFVDAVQAARWMGEHDVLSFCPHIGIASGPVIVGHVGTPLKYDASVFGAPVALAARCADVSPDLDDGQFISSTITFPATEWADRDFKEVIPPQLVRIPEEMRAEGEDEIEERPLPWTMLEPRTIRMKNLPDIEIREIVDRSMHIPSTPAEERAKEGIASLKAAGFYRPRYY